MTSNAHTETVGKLAALSLLFSSACEPPPPEDPTRFRSQSKVTRREGGPSLRLSSNGGCYPNTCATHSLRMSSQGRVDGTSSDDGDWVLEIGEDEAEELAEDLMDEGFFTITWPEGDVCEHGWRTDQPDTTLELTMNGHHRSLILQGGNLCVSKDAWQLVEMVSTRLRRPAKDQRPE